MGGGSTEILHKNVILSEAKNLKLCDSCESAHKSLESSSNQSLESFESRESYESKNPNSQSVICIDCGAHSGLISDIFLSLGAEVVAFEPNAYLFALLSQKYAQNPRIKLHKAACSAQNGTIKFLLLDPISQGNRIDMARSEACEVEEYDEVACIDLVEFIEEKILPRPIYMLKIDIEGAEFEIMEKLIARRLHEKIEFIACETHERYFSDGEEKMARLRGLIKQNNINNIYLDWI